MKRTLIAAAGLALVAASGLASAASWSVVVQPGVYGRVAIGGYVEAPRVYAPQPVVAIDDGDGQVVAEYVDPAYASSRAPVYLWVPEYQRTHWARYCNEYGAYGVPVYFVDDRWYRDNVMRRNWSAQQRSWNQQQWLEQDRLARERFEHERFERQRDDSRRWNDDPAWRWQQHEFQEQRERRAHWDQPRRDHDRQDPDRVDRGAPERMQWGSARSYLPQPVRAPQAIPQVRPQPVGPWQAAANGAPRGSAHAAPVQPIQTVVYRGGDRRADDRGAVRGQYEARRDPGRDR